MPNGGVFGSGTGLQLQPTTPGLADVGNAHITGKMITEQGMLPVRTLPNMTTALDSRPIDIGANNSYPALVQGDDISLGVMIGFNHTLLINPNGNNTQQWVCIGYLNLIKGGQSVTLGTNCINGSGSGYPTPAAPNVVIGNGAVSRVQSATASSVIIGNATGEGQEAPTNGSVLIGRGVLSGSPLGRIIAIGDQITVNATNVIALQTGAAGLNTFNTNNAISIGDASHTGPINIGNLNLRTGLQTGGTAINDADYNVAAGVARVQYSAISAARVVNFPAANSVPIGSRLSVVDASGACSAVNTITPTPAGADTIVGGVATLSAAYAFRQFESDGVSQWILIGQH